MKNEIIVNIENVSDGLDLQKWLFNEGYKWTTGANMKIFVGYVLIDVINKYIFEYNDINPKNKKSISFRQFKCLKLQKI